MIGIFHQQKYQCQRAQPDGDIAHHRNAELLQTKEQPTDIDHAGENIDSLNDSNGRAVSFKKKYERKVGSQRDCGTPELEPVDFPKGLAEYLPIVPHRGDTAVTVVFHAQHGQKHKVVGHRVGIGVNADAVRTKHTADIWCGNKRENDQQKLIDNIIEKIFFNRTHDRFLRIS